ncbi:hypothetical protein BA059_14825 [Mycolicibacterium sp. (ex Dasyatis americana)]|nr:hypothetical protein BA059_14825 [Mycolicibacterium sp. (ex Dasyatis americana)]
MSDKVIRFKGTLPGVKSQREMSRSDWALLGIKSGPHVWSAANDYTLPASEFTPEQLAVLKSDGGFELT